MSRIIGVSFFLILFFQVHSQTINHLGQGDSLFPSGNKWYDYPNYIYDYTTNNATGLSVVKTSGGYIFTGFNYDFSSTAYNEGNALIIDTVNSSVISSRRWRINGRVLTAVSDDAGGFYIGGTFTAIGDSSRSNIAHINRYGIPTPWKVECNGKVNVILKRNDTLFIGGKFASFEGQSVRNFAMYSTTTATPITSNGVPATFNEVRALLLNRDTLILGGQIVTGFPLKGIRKYSFKQNTALPWGLSISESITVNFLGLSPDRNIIIFGADYSGNYLKGASNGTGAILYTVDVRTQAVGNPYSGTIRSLQVSGNKVLVAGVFSHQVSPIIGLTARRSFFAFDSRTGQVLPDDLNLNGPASMISVIGGNMYISGSFTSINNTPRTKFAVLDTGNYQVKNWEISPSDPIEVIAFNSSGAFIAGYMTGIKSKINPGAVAFDSATHTVTNWSSPATSMLIKRSWIRGDSLFLLNNTYSSMMTGCLVAPAYQMKIVSLQSGATYSTGSLPTTTITDFVIEGDYLYAGNSSSIRRYSLPGLQQDPTWGATFSPSAFGHTLNQLFIKGDKIYSIGDSRIISCFSTLEPKRGYFDVISKSTGQLLNFYFYEGADNRYDEVFFNFGVLCDNRLYIQGKFDKLNDSIRRSFACINIDNGKITSWKPAFTINSEPFSFAAVTQMQSFRDKIYFCGRMELMNNGNYFHGFGAIDTLNGTLVTQPLNITDSFLIAQGYSPVAGINGFYLSENELAVAGNFNNVNGRSCNSFAVFPLTGTSYLSFCPLSSQSFTSDLSGNSYQWQLDSGAGFSAISDNTYFSGTQTRTLQLTSIPSSWTGYKFRCFVNNNFSDIFKIGFKNSWTGAVNTLWEVPGNWSCGVVPDQYTDVSILNGTVVVSSDITINTLNVGTGVNLNVLPGNQITVLH